MARSISRMVLAGTCLTLEAYWLVFAIAGCGATPAVVVDPPLGKPITTAIPEGIYLGEITTHDRLWINGELVDDSTTTSPDYEILDSNGLPLIQPGGETPVEGLVLTSNDALRSSRFTVESVRTFGNRLIIGYTGSWEREGIIFSMEGSWTWEYFPPDTLEFTGQVDSVSSVSDSGVSASISTTSTSTLTR